MLVIPVISDGQVVQTDLWWLWTHLTIRNHCSKGILSNIWIYYVVLMDHTLSFIFTKGNKCYERLLFWLWCITIFLLGMLCLNTCKNAPVIELVRNHWWMHGQLCGEIMSMSLRQSFFGLTIIHRELKLINWTQIPHYSTYMYLYIYIFIFLNYL